MKIKDILNNNWSFKTRLLIARRFMTCSNLMKREITNWKHTGVISDRKLSLQVNGVENMTISVLELVNIYGMDPLTAMLYFDDLIKANNNEDKTQLINLIERLQNGRWKKSLTMTPNMLEYIKNNQPKLWSEYQRLQKSVAVDNEKGEEECKEIEETEIPE